MKELIERINANAEAFAKDAQAQVYKGNKAAGARARKEALALMKDLKEFRKLSVKASDSHQTTYPRPPSGGLFCATNQRP